jgi:clan AA aspartic protease
MIIGHVRDAFPRVTLILPGLAGPVNIEFVVDTGFEGELAIPGVLLRRLDAVFVAEHTVLLADQSERHTAHYQILLNWKEEQRPTEVLLLNGYPLMGNLLLEGYSLYVEMTDGGEVLIESL